MDQASSPSPSRLAGEHDPRGERPLRVHRSGFCNQAQGTIVVDGSTGG